MPIAAAKRLTRFISKRSSCKLAVQLVAATVNKEGNRRKRVGLICFRQFFCLQKFICALRFRSSSHLADFRLRIRSFWVCSRDFGGCKQLVKLFQKDSGQRGVDTSVWPVQTTEKTHQFLFLKNLAAITSVCVEQRPYLHGCKVQSDRQRHHSRHEFRVLPPKKGINIACKWTAALQSKVNAL